MARHQSLNILFIGFNAVGVGTYWRMFHLARHLVQLGHQVTILAMSPTNRTRPETTHQQNVKIVAQPDLLSGSLRSGWDLWQTAHKIRWLRQHRYDLIHAFETRPAVLLPALYGRYRHQTPLFFDWCDWFGKGGAVEMRPSPYQRALLRLVDTFFEERFRHHARGTTVICETLKQKAIQLGVPESRLLHLRDGCSIDELQPHPQHLARHHLGLPLDDKIVGYVGAIYQPDAELLAQAFDHLAAADPQVKLLLIGYVNRPIQAMVAHPERVIVTGRVPFSHLNHYIAACDLCWLPYTDSGANRGRWPMKLNDYMAVGKPTVATAVGDVATVLQQNEIGLLTEPTPTAIAHKTKALLDNLDQRIRMGKIARQVAETHFSWLHLTKQLLRFYHTQLA